RPSQPALVVGVPRSDGVNPATEKNGNTLPAVAQKTGWSHYTPRLKDCKEVRRIVKPPAKKRPGIGFSTGLTGLTGLGTKQSC
ncbi:MAG TPA: hypothetical protein VKB78_15820, partial [Pirellulales bacterium]|nr:hypothetical protein [Pirellulales bacterium]